MSAKWIGLIIALVLLVIFAVQNTQEVKIRFLFWLFSTSIVLSILISICIGFLLGWLVFLLKKKKV